MSPRKLSRQDGQGKISTSTRIESRFLRRDVLSPISILTGINVRNGVINIPHLKKLRRTVD
jgi:hypothetical protein